VTSWKTLVRIGGVTPAAGTTVLPSFGRWPENQSPPVCGGSWVFPGRATRSLQVSADRFGTAVTFLYFLLKLLIIEAAFAQRPLPISRTASAFAQSLTFACVKDKFSITYILLNPQPINSRIRGEGHRWSKEKGKVSVSMPWSNFSCRIMKSRTKKMSKS
jgi:hypothetical protein